MKIESLQRMASNINDQGTIVIPYWNKFKKFVHIYFRKNKITEISSKDFQKLTGLKKELSLKLLIELNSEIFIK